MQQKYFLTMFSILRSFAMLSAFEGSISRKKKNISFLKYLKMKISSFTIKRCFFVSLSSSSILADLRHFEKKSVLKVLFCRQMPLFVTEKNEGWNVRWFLGWSCFFRTKSSRNSVMIYPQMVKITGKNI